MILFISFKFLLPHLLPFEDEEISTELEKAFRKQGIQVMTGTRAEKVDRGGESLVVHVKDGDGKAHEIPHLRMQAGF